jgi:hypothetical protein
MSTTPCTGKPRRTRVSLTRLAWLLVWSGLALSAYGYAAFIGKTPIRHVDKVDLAALGSFLQGAVASVWSLAAFIFIYVAFLGQQEELEETRQQGIAQEARSKRERDESLFFNLVDLHRRIVDRVNWPDPLNGGKPVGGNRAFQLIYDHLRTAWQGTAPRNDVRGRIDEAYEHFFAQAEPEVGHYFRNLYHLVRFVDGSDFAPEEKRSFVKFVRAQLSSYEMLLLFYNCLSVYGREKFQWLVVEYAVFEQLPDNLLDSSHFGLYPESAYRDR